MSEDNMRTMLKDVLRRHPGMFLDVQTYISNQEPGSPTPVPTTSNTPSWCKCHNCVEMPSDMERKCCEQTPAKCRSISAVRFNLYYCNVSICCMLVFMGG